MSDGKVQLFVAYFVGITIFMLAKTDQVAAWMGKSGLPTAFAIHLLLNPAYLLIIFGLMFYGTSGKVRNFLAGVAMVVAFDIVSLPRLSPSGFANDLTTLTNIDAIAAQTFVNMGINYQAFLIAYYGVLPIALMLLAVNLLGFRGFWNRITGMAKV
mgnify:CR=1 FL=1